jgi:hypothetical protein
LVIPEILRKIHLKLKINSTKLKYKYFLRFL